MKTAAISSEQIMSTPGRNLLAGVWVELQPGETYQQAEGRLRAEDLERRARRHEDAASSLRQQAAHLRAGGA